MVATMTQHDDDFSVSEGPLLTAKAIRKIIRQLVVSSAILVILAPILIGVAYFEVNPIWGLILTVAVIGIYIVRVMHEGQYRLAHRVESLAILINQTNAERANEKKET